MLYPKGSSSLTQQDDVKKVDGDADGLRQVHWMKQRPWSSTVEVATSIGRMTQVGERILPMRKFSIMQRLKDREDWD